MVNAGHVVGTRGSSIVSSVTDVLWLSLVRVMRGVSGVCETCMCLARSGVGGKGVSGLGLGYQSCENKEIAGRLSVLRWCRWVVGWGFD